MKSYTFSIPEPCHESWQSMTPTACGRYCDNCQKEVVDFSAMTDQEVIAYVEKNGKVCGRFSDLQLNREMHTTPPRKLMPAAMLTGALAGILSILQPQKGKAQKLVLKPLAVKMPADTLVNDNFFQNEHDTTNVNIAPDLTGIMGGLILEPRARPSLWQRFLNLFR